MQRSRKRKLEESQFDDDVDLFFPRHSNEEEVIGSIMHGLVEELHISKPRKHPKIQNRDRTQQKMFWTNGYATWADDEFKERLRINRENFEFILNRIRPMIIKEVTNMVSEIKRWIHQN